MKISVIGAGAMGSLFGGKLSLNGIDVVLYDINEQALQTAITTQDKLLHSLVKENRISEQSASDAKIRIKTTTNAEEAAANADFVSESVLEDRLVKKELY
ncbi:MAG: 3-hydroxybutyryl-CoA dehydrogenase, partial [Spirochaetes bacterium]